MDLVAGNRFIRLRIAKRCIAQVLQLALRQPSISVPVSYPERLFTTERKRQRDGPKRKAALIAGTAITAMAWLGMQNKNMLIQAAHWRGAKRRQLFHTESQP